MHSRVRQNRVMAWRMQSCHNHIQHASWPGVLSRKRKRAYASLHSVYSTRVAAMTASWITPQTYAGSLAEPIASNDFET